VTIADILVLALVVLLRRFLDWAIWIGRSEDALGVLTGIWRSESLDTSLQL
jgi:hypothetical protein